MSCEATLDARGVFALRLIRADGLQSWFGACAGLGCPACFCAPWRLARTVLCVWPVGTDCTGACTHKVWPVGTDCTGACTHKVWPVGTDCTGACTHKVWPVGTGCTGACTHKVWPVGTDCTGACTHKVCARVSGHGDCVHVCVEQKVTLQHQSSCCHVKLAGHSGGPAWLAAAGRLAHVQHWCAALMCVRMCMPSRSSVPCMPARVCAA